jgi:hypothetical protein
LRNNQQNINKNITKGNIHLSFLCEEYDKEYRIEINCYEKKTPEDLI